MDYLRENMSAVVHDLSSVGKGCPDLLVGWRQQTFLLEVKDGTKTPGHRKLTVAEADWHAHWGGLPVLTVLSGEDAVLQITVQRNATVERMGLEARKEPQP